jgi:hypothetical protein
MQDVAPNPMARTRDLGTLAGLVRNFDRDQADATAKLRDWLAADPDGFYRSAIQVLRTEADSRGRRCIVGLLVGGKMLEDALCDAELRLGEAVQVARLAIEIDPQLEIWLARRLAESVAEGQQPAVLANAVRLMSVLAEVSDGKRILPSLARLLHSANPYLRSKAVLMIARGNRSTNWVQNRMLDSDPRNRANAVEALWEVEGYAVRDLLLSAARDGNNRVAGNALLGLYRLGECSALMEAVSMGSHASSSFRLTAAWLMGEMGDERLRAPLAQLMRDPAPSVRLRAFKALGRMKAALAQAASEQANLPDPCRVSGLFAGTDFDPQKAVRKLYVSVTTPDGKEHIKVLPTQFYLREDGSPVLNYRVAQRPAPEAMSVVFVLPRAGTTSESPWVAAVLNCLNWKRTSDLWAYLAWTTQSEEDGGVLGQKMDEALAFSASLQVLATALTAPPARDECSDLWHTMYRALRPETKVGRGRRHVLVFCPDAVSGAGGEVLANALSSPLASVQVISAAPNPRLEALCHRTRTSLVRVESAEAAAAAIEQAYLGLLARYEITYKTVSSAARQLEIQVRSPAGRGALTLAIPAVGPEGQ